MTTRAARLAALAALLLFIALASTAAGANAAVDIAGFAFDPPTVTINIGESVTWTNRDSAQHSAAFVNGGPKTRALSKDQSASLPFTTAGTFSYICGIHGASMMGTVIVRAAATQPPTVAPTAVATPVPTPRPTVAPTATSEPATPTASPAPTATATAAATPAAPSATASASIVAAVPTQQAPAAGASGDGGGPSPLVVGVAVVAALGLAAFAITRLRR
jgi:plastocyanin